MLDTEFKATRKEPYKRLAEINRAITTSLNFDQVLNLIVTNTCQLVDADTSLLLLLDGDGQLRIRASHGLDESVIEKFYGRLEEDVVKELRTLLNLKPTETLTPVPIIDNDSLDGLLVITRQSPISEEEKWQLSALADQAAIALRNARLYEVDLDQANRERRETLQALRASRARISRILESITDLYYSVDKNWCFTDVNRQAELRFGKTRDELVGKSIWEVFPVATDSALYVNFLKALEKNVPIHSELVWDVFPSDWFEAHIYPSQSGLSVYLRDITERKVGEASRRLLASIVESSDDAIISKNLNGIVNSWNRGAELLFGYTAEEMIGKPVTMLIPEDRISEEDAILARIRSGRPVEHYETIRQRKDGTLLHVSLSVSPIRDELGNIIGAAKIARNITEQKRAEEERTRLLESERLARKEAEAANRLKDEFLATLSHELRNPLNVVIGYSEILRRGEGQTNSFVGKVAEVIRRNALAQSQLVSDLLDLSRLQMGKLAITRQPVSLSTILGDAIETVRTEAEAKDITLKSNAFKDSLVVNGDPVRLGQIVWNLLNNAVKFTGAGGHISISLAEESNEAVLSVTDTGQGIAPEFLPFVFEIFRQADASSSRRQGGLGIGLALVKQLAELHGGRVKAESEGIGKGATFQVWFPIQTNSISDTPAKKQSPDGILEHKFILVVDDSRETTEMLSKLLQMEGAIVQTARSGEDAIGLATQNSFDLVISDISMPEMDGYELLRQLRKLSTMDQVPAVALTGFGRISDVDRARAVGFAEHFTKPIDVDKLLAAVKRLTTSNTKSS